MSQHHWFKPYTNGILSVSCQENLGHASSQERLRHKETKLKQTKSKHFTAPNIQNKSQVW